MQGLQSARAGRPCRCRFGVPGRLPTRRRTLAAPPAAAPAWLPFIAVSLSGQAHDAHTPLDSQLPDGHAVLSSLAQPLAGLLDASQFSVQADGLNKAASALSAQVSGLSSQLGQQLPEVALQSKAAITQLASHLAIEELPKLSAIKAEADSAYRAFERASLNADVDPILRTPAAAGIAGVILLVTLGIFALGSRPNYKAGSSRAPGDSPSSSAAGRSVTESKKLGSQAGALDGVVEIAYVSGWERPTVHGCVAGQEWTTWTMQRKGKHLTMRAEVPKHAENGSGVFEFVITDGSGNWDKTGTGENYVVPEPGKFELRDGNLTKL